jgi:GNAT superfamily N-acetyltransferase
MNARAGLALRVARPEDADAVSEALRASYGALYRGWYRDDVLALALPAMTRANPRLLASGRYFVVEAGGRVISCGGWSHDNPSGVSLGHVGHIRHFATHPDYLNRGAASAIMARCLSEAKAAGLSAMEVVSSLAAEAFYAGRGFRPLGVIIAPMGGAEFACVRMGLGLS